MKVVLSFDDGNISDLKAANLLTKYGLKGIFYVSNAPVPGTTQLFLKECKKIADMGHELGGHTVTHPSDMKLIESDDELKFEIENNKAMIEMLLEKHPITKFCYPRGRHDERVRKAVKAAGYTEARTTRVLQLKNDTLDPFQTPTTIHMFQREEYEGISWFDMADRYFAKALDLTEQGDEDVVFSLWGHTVELNRQDDWEAFEKMLIRINNNRTIWEQ